MQRIRASGKMLFVARGNDSPVSLVILIAPAGGLDWDWIEARVG